MFTREKREQIRAALVNAAQADPKVAGAAHLGSAAADRLDDWSDIDLALCILPEGEREEVIASWTGRLYRDHGAVAHCDVKRGDTLYRVFLLHNTLQVDISFWPARQFRAVGPKFKLIFGVANEPQPSAADSTDELIGMAWLYALHVRSSIARHRLLQAEYMLSSMRNQVLALACLRQNLPSREGRGFDDLAQDERCRFAECYPLSFGAQELHRALQRTMTALLIEIRFRDIDLAKRIGPTLIEIARHDGGGLVGPAAGAL
jgi:predicted nucleotidyltransferase